MKLAVILDPLARLDPSGDTSIALIEAAQALGHASFIAETRELAVLGGRTFAPLRRIHIESGRQDGVRWIAPDPWYELAPAAGLVALDEMDAVLFRTDPPVDSRYLFATYILDAIDPTRTVLVNDPRGVREANEKLFPMRYPDVVPPTMVSADATTIRSFVDDHICAVAKPIDGHAGRSVMRLVAGDPNLPSIVEVMTARGAQPIVVQAWLAAASNGNRRLLVYDGDVLGSVNRQIETGDFRTGNPNEAVAVTARDREIVGRLAPDLRRLGLRFVGLDVIGEYLIEVNVTSPGGIRQAEGLGLAGMARTVIERIEADVSTRR